MFGVVVDIDWRVAGLSVLLANVVALGTIRVPLSASALAATQAGDDDNGEGEGGYTEARCGVRLLKV